MDRSTRIASSTGYIAKIDYSGKGWLGGKKNSFTAILYKEDEGEKNPLYTAEGQWSGTFVIKDNRTKTEVDQYTVGEQERVPLKVAAITDQDPYESRRAWQDVASAIERGDMEATSIAKSKIENAQRELRRIEKEEGREWERRFFKQIDVNDDDTFIDLATALGITDNIDSDKTGGVWRFDRESAKDAKTPYHKVGSDGLGQSN